MTTKRKLFHKNLPRLVKRKLFIKQSDNDEVIVPSRIFVVLHITYKSSPLNNETFKIAHSISDRRSLGECPYFEIHHSDNVCDGNLTDTKETKIDYSKHIEEYMRTEFGILPASISRIRYDTQIVVDDDKYFNLFDVEMTTLHEHFPTRYESRSPYLIVESSAEEPAMVQEPTYVFHKNKWIWRENIELVGITSKISELSRLSIDFFDDELLLSKRVELMSTLS